MVRCWMWTVDGRHLTNGDAVASVAGYHREGNRPQMHSLPKEGTLRALNLFIKSPCALEDCPYQPYQFFTERRRRGKAATATSDFQIQYHPCVAFL